MKTRNEIEQEIIEKAAKDEAFLKQLKENPKKAIADFLPDQPAIPDNITIKVVQETPTELVIRLPYSVSEDDELDADQLDNVSAGGYLDYNKERHHITGLP